MILQQRSRDDEGTPAGFTPARLTPAGLTPDFAQLATPRPPKRAPAILLWVIGVSAGIGAFLLGLFYALGADGAPPEGFGETVGATLVGGLQGAIVGVAFGLVLALPAAIIVWFLRRGRR
jgi:hypothetical protein